MANNKRGAAIAVTVALERKQRRERDFFIGKYGYRKFTRGTSEQNPWLLHLCHIGIKSAHRRGGFVGKLGPEFVATGLKIELEGHAISAFLHR